MDRYYLTYETLKPLDLPLDRFRIQVVSDIHLEMRGGTAPPIGISAEVLALCGDIGYPELAAYADFIGWASSRYTHVFVISGNHEYWSKKTATEDMDKLIKEICSRFPNVTPLINSVITVNTKTQSFDIFGATFWTDTSSQSGIVRWGMSDYKKITIRVDKDGLRKRKPIMPFDTSLMHRNTVACLKAFLKTAKNPVIVLSHHLPSKKCSKIHDEMTIAYASNLDELLEPPVILWAHGHSHQSEEIKIGGVTVVSNQMGYIDQTITETDYREFMFVDVTQLLLDRDTVSVEQLQEL